MRFHVCYTTRKHLKIPTRDSKNATVTLILLQRWGVLAVSWPRTKLAKPAVNLALELSFDAVRADRGLAHRYAVSLANASLATPSTSF